TWEGIKNDLAFIEATLPGVSIRLVANKKDLVEAVHVAEAQDQFEVDYVTSAKTGEQVEALFENLAEEIYDK
ncbi:MAG: GTP-binding protein, partial [Bacteroidota bacterium]